MSLAAASYYGFPHRDLYIVGVTGTDGKTTTTHLIYHILKSAGKKVSMVSSVYAEIAGKRFDTGFHVTTPDAWMLQKFLHEVVAYGDKYMVIEVTSHSLDQQRVLGIHFNIGVVTNITHEHLDYHKTYLNYVRAKERLLANSQTAILNIDDESYQYFKSPIVNKSISYGINHDAQVTPKKFPFLTSLPGTYNRYNCLAAMAVTQKIGIPHLQVLKGLKSFTGVKGRYERVHTSQGFEIIIDFAHTPNAIKNLLSTVKSEIKGKGRLIHLFGSAGLRDASKRSLMGKQSVRFANIIILTEEDYRTENVDVIIDAIAKGCVEEGAVELTPSSFGESFIESQIVFFRIHNRQDAVNFALQRLARAGDIVVLTGKGHESSLCRGITESPWSEFEAVTSALETKVNHEKKHR